MRLAFSEIGLDRSKDFGTDCSAGLAYRCRYAVARFVVSREKEADF